MRDTRAFCKDLKKALCIYVVSVKKITDPDQIPLLQEFADFKDVVASSSVADRPLLKGMEHAIDLELRTKLPFRPLYNLSNSELKALREYLEQAQKNGWI